VAAALALAFVSLVPQLELWRERGREWHGSDFSFFFDESAYAAYVNALISGRPRLNDPYTGRDDETSAPQPESLFSIQFVPAYALALPARLFGLSAATVFIILCPLVAFASTLALTRLVAAVTGDGRTAATVALVVLCFCTFIQKTVRTLLGLQTDYFPLPFLRRYLPALPFALFFVFCLFVWRALTVNDDDHNKRPSLMNAVYAGLTFAVLVYSYFYLWTAAAAWLACLALLWLALAQREERGRAARALLIIVAIAAVSLAPYAWLLSRRAASMETVQAFVYTRDPNPLRTSELLGALACLVIIFGAWRGWLAWRDRSVLFAASFALMPFVVFNQQIITGRSLQPIHYEQFIANYVSLLALMLAGVLCWQGRAAAGRERGGRGGGGGRIAPKVLASVAVVMLGWALVEVTLATRRARDLNLWRDEVRPVSLRLAEMAKGGEATSSGERSLVFFPDIAQGDRLPSIAPQAVLWAQHLFVFSGATLSEERERLYLQLYYSNVDEQKFATFIDRPHAYRPSILGWSRVLNGLDATRTPITAEDLAAERRAYALFLSSFNRERAARLPLSYVVVTAGQNELGNLDLWYTRDAGERIGYHVIYRVKLRP